MQTLENRFANAASVWLCDSSSVGISFIARKTKDSWLISSATLSFGPLNIKSDQEDLLITNDYICAGSIHKNFQTKESLLKIMQDAIRGSITMQDRLLGLAGGAMYYKSDFLERNLWFHALDLRIESTDTTLFTELDLAAFDTVVRQASTPFDGVDELTTWHGLNKPSHEVARNELRITILPPIDLMINKSRLNQDVLELVFHAHPTFDTRRAKVAIIPYPTRNKSDRRQISDLIDWKDKTASDLNVGTVSIEVSQANSVLVFLTIDEWTVRRQYFQDPAKARNNRLIAFRHFDKNLKMLSKELSVSASDSFRFEIAVADVLFLLGFSASIQLENDAPDIIAMTPNGRVLLIECTTRIADFQNKIGKLVDRLGSLTHSMKEAGNRFEVTAVLVCALPRNRIAANEASWKDHGIILVCQEQLTDALLRLDSTTSPDKSVDDAIAFLANPPAEARPA